MAVDIMFERRDFSVILSHFSKKINRDFAQFYRDFLAALDFTIGTATRV